MAAASHSPVPTPPQGESVLGVFAKRPVAGAVKTRLAAATSPEWAARVAEAFLRDTLDRFKAVSASRILAFAPPTDREFFETLAGDRYVVEPQAAGDLGDRLKAFVRTQLDRGAGQVVVIGTDSPTLPVEFVAEAFDRLAESDVVLGPATDGGYYLLGCARCVPLIFDGISWGRATVLAETIVRLDDPGWRLAVLPPWYDVDTLEDWQHLAGHVSACRRAGQAFCLPAIEQVMADGSDWSALHPPLKCR